MTPREPTFQVVLDAIALTPCYLAFLITADVPKIFPRVPGRDFDPLPSEEDTVSFLRELGHTGEINSLNDVVIDQMHQPWRTFVALINQGLSEKISGLDKLRLSRAQILWGVVPPKMAQKFKKASPSKKDSDLVLVDEEPVTKGKRVKRPAKKSTTKPAAGVIIREALVETKSKSKENEKVDVTRGKGIELLSETHPSGSCTVDEKPPSVDKITPTVTSEGTGDKPGVPDVTEDDSTENDDQEEEEFVHTPSPTDDKDDDNLESESDDVNKAMKKGADAKMIDAQQGNENLVTTQEQVVEDAHVTISTVTKKTEVPVTSSSHVHVHHEVPRTQVPTLLTIPVSVITESSPVYTNIPQSSQTFTPPPILTTPNPSPTIETTNPLSILPDFASVFRFNDRITTLEKEVAKLKKDPLHTQVTTLVDEHLDTRLGETREEFMNFFLESLTARIKEQVKDQLPQILPKEVSNFAPPVIEALIKESRDEVTLEKVSSQPHSTYEAASTLTEFELKKILIDKMEKKPTTGSKKKDSTSGSSKGTKSQPKSSRKSIQSEEPMFEVADSDIPQDQEGNLGDNEDEPRNETASRPSTSIDKSLKDFDELMSTPIDFSSYILNGLKIENLTQEILLGPAFRLLKGTHSNYVELEYDFEECYKALSQKLDWENHEGGDYPFDLSNPLPLITRGNHQRVPFKYFVRNSPS
ncbi:hypothetical protein Tco_1436956 [Tanacetum coccineum]